MPAWLMEFIEDFRSPRVPFSGVAGWKPESFNSLIVLRRSPGHSMWKVRISFSDKLPLVYIESKVFELCELGRKNLFRLSLVVANFEIKFVCFLAIRTIEKIGKVSVRLAEFVWVAAFAVQLLPRCWNSWSNLGTSFWLTSISRFITLAKG